MDFTKDKDVYVFANYFTFLLTGLVKSDKLKVPSDMAHVLNVSAPPKLLQRFGCFFVLKKPSTICKQLRAIGGAGGLSC